jgi:hypothetical protein
MPFDEYPKSRLIVLLQVRRYQLFVCLMHTLDLIPTIVTPPLSEGSMVLTQHALRLLRAT